jgi:hypothetical protein
MKKLPNKAPYNKDRKMMVDFHLVNQTIRSIGREDRAMLGSNPSARTDGGTSSGASAKKLSFYRCSCPTMKNDVLPPKAINPCRLITTKFQRTTTGVPFGKISGAAPTKSGRIRKTLIQQNPQSAIRNPQSAIRSRNPQSTHSYLRATIGATFVARRAGI